jgi:hypothetical protein
MSHGNSQDSQARFCLSMTRVRTQAAGTNYPALPSTVTGAGSRAAGARVLEYSAGAVVDWLSGPVF